MNRCVSQTYLVTRLPIELWTANTKRGESRLDLREFSNENRWESLTTYKAEVLKARPDLLMEL